MALTETEAQRLRTLEAATLNLAKLVEGGGSKNQLNRIDVLAQDEIRKLEVRVEAIESKVDTILTLVRKLQ